MGKHILLSDPLTLIVQECQPSQAVLGSHRAHVFQMLPERHVKFHSSPIMSMLGPQLCSRIEGIISDIILKRDSTIVTCFYFNSE